MQRISDLRLVSRALLQHSIAILWRVREAQPETSNGDPVVSRWGLREEWDHFKDDLSLREPDFPGCSKSFTHYRKKMMQATF